MIAEHVCKKCGAALKRDALQGLCARCLGRLAFEMEVPDTPTGLIGGEILHRNFGGYEILGEIARGGMGVVYMARQTGLNRIVALKMILDGPFSNAEFVRRFQIEAEAAARLHHPNIVAIYEVGEWDGHRYLAMEFVEGPDFAALAKERPLPARVAAEQMKCVAEAIQYAHEMGVVHRDLKPSNLLLDAMGQPRVTDFGLAKVLTSDLTLTVTGQAFGSPGYMAPERAGASRHGDSGAHGDIYSLGAMLYYLVTCRAPFQGATPQDVLVQILNSEPVPPSRLIPNRVQDETNSLVFQAAGFVARSLQIAADMRLARVSPAARNPARLSLTLNSHWNNSRASCGLGNNLSQVPASRAYFAICDGHRPCGGFGPVPCRRTDFRATRLEFGKIRVVAPKTAHSNSAFGRAGGGVVVRCQRNHSGMATGGYTRKRRSAATAGDGKLCETNPVGAVCRGHQCFLPCD